jgi:hypothetical protein
MSNDYLVVRARFFVHKRQVYVGAVMEYMIWMDEATSGAWFN